MKAKVNKGVLNGSGFRFAIIVSSWNDAITSKLLDGALEALEKTGVQESNVEIFRVPGSYEIPLIALKAAKTGKFDALICLGTIIRGETPHFEYVASEVAKGISQVAIQVELPVIFGIVTADNIEQAMNRAGIKLGNKGYEAAMTAVEMANLCKSIQESLKE
ncbi:MAG: 6,7-dimethyl-8-ribityllumazine synthase [Acidobacteria bacterium]|nr:MAG: 6,7-dimethyl-8-ribityllumazine synthase [Acidobacteriota bacterium]